MAADTKAAMIKTLVALMTIRISMTAVHVKSAVAMMDDDVQGGGFDILLEAEQPLHEAQTLLNTISLVFREES